MPAGQIHQEMDIPVLEGEMCIRDSNLTAPSDLQFSNITPTSLTLSWKGSTDVGGPGVAGYYIIRNGVTVGQVGVVTSYNDTTVLPNTLYTYQVEAFITPTEVSALSPSASITTPSTVGNQKPSAPTSLTAKVVGYNQVNLGWGASTACLLYTSRCV